MFLNIITPCIRPYNLESISNSINIPKDNYRWIVVFDNDVPLEAPANCETYAIKDTNSTSGNAQRNYGINLVKEGWVYFNDDDTIIQSNLWENIKDIDVDFIHFMQNLKDGNLRLSGENVKLNEIDSHNFIVKHDIIKDERFALDIYHADGIFAENTFKKATTKLYIPKVLSIYNSLK
jgi:hypothetical protein